MRKSEMSPLQLQERALFVQNLTSAGWKGCPLNATFDQDFWLSEEAVMDYDNSEVKFVLSYCAKDHSMELLVDQDWRYDFVIHFGQKQAEVLRAIIAFQDRLSFENLAEELPVLMQLCPGNFFIYSDEYGLVKIDAEVLASL